MLIIDQINKPNHSENNSRFWQEKEKFDGQNFFGSSFDGQIQIC